MTRLFNRQKVSFKLSCIVGAALLALCVMGTIAVIAAEQIRQLGQNLRVEVTEFLDTEMALQVDVQRAVGVVHSAPSELDLGKLKEKRVQFSALLANAKKRLRDMSASGKASNVSASVTNIISTLDAFGTESTKVFDFTASFAQPDAIAALSEKVEPVEKQLQAALKQYRTAADLSSEEKETAITATIGRLTVLVIGLAVSLVVGLGLIAYVIVSRGVVKPLVGLVDAMHRLGDGDFSVVLPGLGRKDEVGQMAEAVEAFKAKAAEKAQREAEQKTDADRLAAAARKSEMRKLADTFEMAVGEVVTTVSAASTELEHAAKSLTATAEVTQRLAGGVAAASEQASENVQSVATAAEEMTTSVREIGRQVQDSSRIANEAVKQAGRTDARINELSQAAGRIGDVVKLITAIAEQTNLLALNATIEAARAGEAGKGFAVVAQEVKALASQTAKATGEIGSQISAMQAATQESVAAIKEIGATIGHIADIATSIAAAVEEQDAVTAEIARNVQQAAHGTTQVAANITEVNRGAGETGSASGQVLSSAQQLAGESNRLKREVEKFLTTVRAA
jgi:methyl-accepting chemotaxis protein